MLNIAVLGAALLTGLGSGVATAAETSAIGSPSIGSSESTCRPLPAVQAFLKAENQHPNPLDSLTPASVIALRADRDSAAAHPLRAIKLKSIRNVEIPAGEPDHPHQIPLRIYTPFGRELARHGRLPVVMFVHGGGWTLGSIASYDSVTRELARLIPAMVVSVDYRLAPEHPFPAGLDDAYTALQWIGAHIQEYGGDPTRIGITGDSGGGNLSTVVAMKARHEGNVRVLQETLFYPSTNISSTDTQSYKAYGTSHLLTQKSVELFRDFYLPNKADWTNPYASPLLASDLSKMPQTLIITAGCDPLHDEGYAYAKKLEKAGVPVIYKNEPGLIHAFLNLFNYEPAITPYAEKSLQYAATVMRKAFAHPSSGRASLPY